MKLKFQQKYWIGIIGAIFLIIADFILFLGTRWFYAVFIVAISVGWAQFWMDFLNENKRQKEIEEKFIEFVRNLVGMVKSGISIPNAIVQVVDGDYGALNPYTKKLGRQIEWGIPVQEALVIFANDTYNPVIKRSVSIVIEAERSGGGIEDVLREVSNSVVNVKKMKQERKSSTYSQVVQGYIVFFVFIIIMLVLQLWLFPKIAEMSSSFSLGLGSLGVEALGAAGETANLDRIFFGLVIVQGFFAGIMIGKFSEGRLRNGLIHSLILITIATLIITTVKGGI
ncbi:MAG: type II secretion system F family protein [Candidatus Nanoarchaeia archaeon]|nr:type II secretion system F family protein [Candidatus Nanoarchaeia archaeon]